MRRARTGPSARKKESIGAGTKEPLNLFVRIDSPGFDHSSGEKRCETGRRRDEETVSFIPRIVRTYVAVREFAKRDLAGSSGDL